VQQIRKINKQLLTVFILENGLDKMPHNGLGIAEGGEIKVQMLSFAFQPRFWQYLVSGSGLFYPRFLSYHCHFG